MPIVFTQHQEEGTFAVTFAAGCISGTIVINHQNPINLFLPVGLPSPNPTTTSPKGTARPEYQGVPLFAEGHFRA